MEMAELKYVIETELKNNHVGHEKKAEKWEFVEKIFGVQIPEAERNNLNKYERRARMAMSELRQAGVLICSDTAGGYWLADSLDDALGVANDFRSRAKDLLLTARQLRQRARATFGGQLRLM